MVAVILVIVSDNKNTGTKHDSICVGGTDCNSVVVGGSSSSISSYERLIIGSDSSNTVDYCSATYGGAFINFSGDNLSTSVVATMVVTKAASLDTCSFVWCRKSGLIPPT